MRNLLLCCVFIRRPNTSRVFTPSCSILISWAPSSLSFSCLLIVIFSSLPLPPPAASPHSSDRIVSQLTSRQLGGLFQAITPSKQPRVTVAGNGRHCSTARGGAVPCARPPDSFKVAARSTRVESSLDTYKKNPEYIFLPPRLIQATKTLKASMRK